MEAKLISEKLKIAKKYYVRNCVVFNKLYFSNGAMYTTNGDVQYSFENELFNGLNVSVDFDMFKKIIDKVKKGTIVIDSTTDGITIRSGSNNFTIGATENENIPIVRSIGEVKESFIIKETDATLINKAFNYIAKDELRPTMNEVCLRDGFVHASDAHKLCYYESTIDKDIDILIKTPLLCSCKVNAGKIYNEFLYFNEKIIERRLDGRFPNAWAVIPENNPIKLKVKTKDLLEKLESALIVANPASQLAVLDMSTNGSIIISKDVDYDSMYSSNLPNATGNIRAGVKIPFLINILKTEGDEETTLSFSDNARPIIINDKVILMPMMVND